MATTLEELKYLRLQKESKYGEIDSTKEHIDIEISEMDLSPPEQFTKFEGIMSRDYNTGMASYYVLENSFSCNVTMDNLPFLLEAVLGKREGDIIYGTNSSILDSFTIFGGYGTYEKEILGAIFDSLSLEVESEFITASTETKAKIDSKKPLKDISEFEFDELPLSFFNIDKVQMKRESDDDWMEMRCKTNKITLDLKNNINTDDARGMGSRFMCKTPRAGKRDIGLTLTADGDEKYLEMYWGSDEGPRQCLAGEFFELKLYIINGNRKFEIYCPKCLINQPSGAANADPMKYELNIITLAKKIPSNIPHYGGFTAALIGRIADSDPNPEYDITFKIADTNGNLITDEDITVSLMDGLNTIDADTTDDGVVTLQAENGRYSIELTGTSTITSFKPTHILVDGASKTKTIIINRS
ncbi:MAG: Ig-like domain-containing protein [Methanobacteriaceae archaeon]|jgi:hypothetical protein|nr:Ig-like domain-containing protein [Methanobacteriaceae archaeon]